MLHCLRLDVVEAAGYGSATLLSGILFSSLVGGAVAGIASGESAESAVGLCFALLGVFALVDALGDVASAWLDPRDVVLLRTLPIAPGRYARARMAALALPVAAKGLALVLPCACAAMSRGAVRQAIAWTASFLLFAAFLAGLAVVLLLLLRRAGFGARVRDVLAWLRALLLITATGGWLALPPAAAGGLARGSGAAWLPSAWFSELALGLGGAPARPAMAIGALAALLAVALALWLTTRGYLSLLESLAAAPVLARRRSPPPWRRAFERWFVPLRERPTFRLALLLLRRERSFRLQALPLLAYPLLFLSMGRGAEDGGLFALLFAQLPALVLALTGLLLRYSDSPAGGFLLRWHGASRSRSLERGARKACWFAVALPLSIVVATMLAHDRGAAFGVAAGAVGLFSSTLALLGGGKGLPALPFVERFRGRVEGSEGGRVFGLLASLFGVALVAWRVLQWGRSGTLLVAIAAVAGAVVLLRRQLPEAREPLPPLALEPGERAGLVIVPSRVPFALRLQRELRGLAAFFIAAAALFTAFYAWL